MLFAAEDATAEEYMDFYLDDDARMGWDSMISGEKTNTHYLSFSDLLAAWLLDGPCPAAPLVRAQPTNSCCPPRPPNYPPAEAQLLESGGPPGGRGQVVRWLRTFPFSFISQVRL